MARGIYSTEGIVIRSIKYGETSMITDIFTKEFGLKSYIIGGIRSKKTIGKASQLYPLTQVMITAYPNSDGQLSRLKSVEYSKVYTRLNSDVITTAVGSFLSEICKNTISETEQNVELYDFLMNEFNTLDELTNLKFFHIKFLLKLSHLLGFGPLANYSKQNTYFNLKEGLYEGNFDSRMSLDANVSYHFFQIHQNELADLHTYKITKGERDQLLDSILKFYIYHIDGFKRPKSLDILRTIMS